jgi:1,4-alpha-glucan branching enzyme
MIPLSVFDLSVFVIKSKNLKGVSMTKKIAASRPVQFEYNDDEASSVFLVGDFNAWNRKKHEMEKNDDGTYRKTLMLSPKPYEYKFLVDGQWKKDP